MLYQSSPTRQCWLTWTDLKAQSSKLSPSPKFWPRTGRWFHVVVSERLSFCYLIMTNPYQGIPQIGCGNFLLKLNGNKTNLLRMNF